jgi:hypothetical protein
MKTEIDINKNILKITMTIRDDFPELLKFLNEMPETIPGVKNPKINTSILNEYYNSLNDILANYTSYHTNKINKLEI